MPPAAGPRLSLRELADLAIGTPEVGAVNFTALHTLIVAMLKHLNLQAAAVDLQALSPEAGRSLESLRAAISASQPREKKEERERRRARAAPALESQVQDLSKHVRTVDGGMQALLSHVQGLAPQPGGLHAEAPEWLDEREVAMLYPEKAQATPTGVPKDAGAPGIPKDKAAPTVRKEAAAPGTPKAMRLLQDVLEDVKTLKANQQRIQEFPELKSQEILQRLEDLERVVRDREDFLEHVSVKLGVAPGAEEVTMVTWEELEQAITDGWKASQGSTDTSSKRKTPSSVTSNEIPSGASTKQPSTDQSQVFAGGPDQTLSESGGADHRGLVPEGVTAREQTKGPSATRFPAREQHPRARDEASTAKPRQPSAPQVKAEPERRRGKDLATSGRFRRDERDTSQQDLPPPRDRHHHAYPEQPRGVPAAQGHVHPRPDHHGGGPPGTGQPGFPYPGTHPHTVVPHSVGQLSVLPPEMGSQGFIPFVMDQRGMVPPLVPGRDQQGLEQPGIEQLGMAPHAAYPYGVPLPGTDQHAAEWPGMYERAMGPLGTDQRGLIPVGIDQNGFVIYGTDQQGLVPLGMDQPGLVPPSMGQPGPPSMDQPGLVPPSMGQPGPPGMDQPGLVSPAGMQISPDQQGSAQPTLEASGFTQPGSEQHDWVQPGMVQPVLDHRGLAQSRSSQHGLVHPGTGRRGVVRPALVPPSAGQPGLVQPGTYPPSLAQLGIDQHGSVQPGIDQDILVQSGAYLPYLVQPGAVQQSLVQPGAVEQGLVQPGAVQGLVQAGTDQQGLVQPGAVQQGFVQPGAVQQGFVQPGAVQGFVQPGAVQQGFVQPGEVQGLVQPGAVQGLVQPGAVQQGLVQPGADQQGLVQLGAYQRGLVYPGVYQRGLVQPGMDQYGMAQPGIDQPGGLVPPGTDQHGLIQPGMSQPGLMQPGTSQHGLVRPGMGQRGLVQPGTGQRGSVQPGADQRGSVQPGMGQRGSVQPGADQRGSVQPGMGQRGSVQPGADQRGSVQPGMGQRGSVQPGADQRGSVQPGMDQRGSVQPGADQRGSVQPGMGQRGSVQPGADQRGSVQPGMGQRDSVQPGADQRGLTQPDIYQPGGLEQSGADQGVLVPPGMDQHDLAQPGTDQPGASLVPRGIDQHGFVQPGMYPRGFVQPGMYPRGFVQPGMYPRGLVQPGMYPRGFVQPGMYPRGLVQPGMYPRGFVQPGMYPRGLVQPGAGQRGLVQPGADEHGLVQPGVKEKGLVQPGAEEQGLVQPGAEEQGLEQPGMDQSGLVQPGTGQFGTEQPGVGSAGLQGMAQPGMYMPGLAYPGAYPGWVQPGAYPPRLVQPGAYPPGLAQPGTGPHVGVTASGTELHDFPPFLFGPQGLAFPRLYQQGAVPPGQEQHGLTLPLRAIRGLGSPNIGQMGLVSSETDQQGLRQKGPTPSTGLDQPGQDHPDAGQPGRVYSLLDYRGLEHPASGSQEFPGVGLHGQAHLDLSSTSTSDQPELLTQPYASSFLASRDSLSLLRQISSERSESLSETQSQRRESLIKLAPSFPLALETFRLVGEMVGFYVELKESIKDLEDEQAGQTDLEKLQYLLGMMVKKVVPPDLQEQLKLLRTLAKEVRQDKAKLDRMQRLLEGDEREGGKEMKGGQLGLQLGILRATVADIEKELAELRDSQEQGKASLENSVTEASLYLQDQLDKLRTIIENMLASSSTLLSMSMMPHNTLTDIAPGQIDPEATCPACSLDLGHQVSTLVQRYEQLQDMVNNLAASRPSKKAKLQSQDEELLGHVQSAILQVQGDCEKLNLTTCNLIEDHRQKQKDIDVLYQSLEKLEKEKANREHLEMEIDVKADKSALAAKVSRVQFDATTEQLNHMMKELVAKMSGQEQDWQKMLDKLLVEMDSKLDRLELDPVKQSLEDRWKSLRQQLKEHSPMYQADEAAIMRRQLLAHFHCLSCDRPLETPVTGQMINVTPVGPSLPGHRSLRPYTVFELEQVRQQSRNLRLGSTFSRGDLSPMERSVGRLRTMHSKMLMDIEKVQIHFGGSVKASSQMIRELLHTQCGSSPCYKRVPDAMVDYSFSSVPRRCGGSHTLTYPYRRTRLQHLSQGSYAPEEIQIAMKHDEVDILGLDGHIYKGRMDTRLPSILTKDSPVITKAKSKQSRPNVHRTQTLSSQPPSRPQSARILVDTNSASSRQQDRPVSSEGRPSQLAHLASPSTMATLQGGPQGRDMPPGEGLEEPTRGPRSTTAH